MAKGGVGYRRCRDQEWLISSCVCKNLRQLNGSVFHVHGARPPKGGRAISRLARVLHVAKVYQAASIRVIVRAVGMSPGSLYCHFAHKEELLAAAYAKGLRRIGDAVRRSVGHHTNPWIRLEAACAAHVESRLDHSACAKVLISVGPHRVTTLAHTLVALRDGHEPAVCCSHRCTAAAHAARQGATSPSCRPRP